LRHIFDAAQTDWIEWQAGYVCGALLMPASKVRELAGANLESQGLFGVVGQRDSHGLALFESSKLPNERLESRGTNSPTMNGPPLGRCCRISRAACRV
jgi:hypothetical protein